jgi:glucan biosynthesis protein C
MAIRPCRECNAQVSTKAKVCPQCGVRDPTAGLKSRKMGSNLNFALAYATAGSNDCTSRWTKTGRPAFNLVESPDRSRSGLALRNLRGVVIIIVLAFHAVLAYVDWSLPHSSGFNDPAYKWRAFPIIDARQWFGFDLFCVWQDVYLMSLMFFLSGLFVWPSLQRKHSFDYARERLARLGIPFAFGVIVLMPVAFYPGYLVSTASPSIADYVQRYLALPFVPNGQLWFLWQLLALNLVATVIYFLAPGAFPALARWSKRLEERPQNYYAALAVISALVYVPVAYAFTPWAWSNSGILSIQWCRPLLYAVYFFAGIGVGTGGIDVGLLAANGALARHWRLWLLVAIVSWFAWMGVTYLTLNGDAPTSVDIAADLMFVLACAGGCFFLVATSLRFLTKRSAVLDSLSVNAYSLYLVHYDFVVWLQYALLGWSLFALIKGAIVFGATLVLSWITVVGAQHVPFAKRLIAVPPRPRADATSSSSAAYARLRQIVSP